MMYNVAIYFIHLFILLHCIVALFRTFDNFDSTSNVVATKTVQTNLQTSIQKVEILPKARCYRSKELRYAIEHSIYKLTE